MTKKSKSFTGLLIQIAGAFLISIIIIGILGFVKYTKIAKAIENSKNFAPPPDSVTTAVAVKERWNKTVPSVGSLTPVKGITVATELEGKITKINFESGQYVHEGDLLVELDTSVEEANLKQAIALQERGRSSFERNKSLRGKNAISIDEYENSEMQYRQAQAQVEALKATIQKKKIVAPFSGYTGIRMVNLGDYLSAGKAIVPLQYLEQLYLNFSVPQTHIQKVVPGLTVLFSVEGYDDKEFSGKISAVNPELNQATRNFEVQAIVDNVDKKLKPGMFADIKVMLDEFDETVVIPSTSISFAPYGNSVYVVEKKKDDSGKDIVTVRQQFVKTGVRKDDLVSVLEGIKEGDEVVTSGLFKLRPGGKIMINNSVSPEKSEQPNPKDT